MKPMEFCPKCNYMGKLWMERSPDGNSCCGNCGYIGKHSDWVQQGMMVPLISKCFFEHASCGPVVAKWTNSRGEEFKVCEKHLHTLQCVADDYEETAPDEFRVVRDRNAGV